MRRRDVHVAFAAVALLASAAIACQGLELWQAAVINRDLAAAQHWAAGRQRAGMPNETAGVDRRVVLAHGVALSSAGNADAALRTFNALLVHGADDEVARAALFDLGNLYLRQGVRASGNAAVFLPMLELAKQRYRDVLRIDPSDWDARFNLERALRYAPEEREAFEQPEDRPVERPPNKLPELLAPDLP
jgi:mxaK protein